MEKMSMCRICLSDVIPLRSIVNTHLEEMYECLTKMPFVTEDRRPILACDICCTSLENSYELRRRCLKSEELISQLLRSNLQVNLQITPDRHLSLGDVIQTIAIEYDNSAVKQEDAEGFEENLLKGDDYLQSLGSGEMSPAVFKKEQSDAMAYDASVEQDDADLCYGALGLHTEYDIPLDIVKEESDVDDGAPVPEQHILGAQKNREDTYSSRKISEAKAKVQDSKKDTKKFVQDKEKIGESQNRTDIKLCKYKGRSHVKEGTTHHTNVPTEISEHKISADQSTDSSSKKPKLYSCDTCQKCFSVKSQLPRHIRTHTDEKPYQCNVCKKKFSLKGNLDVHIRTHTDEKPYQCNICKKYFNRDAHLKRHFLIHTGEKPYQCNVCKKSFLEKSALIVHSRTHTGEKPYQCNVCKKCFSLKGTLDVHIRTHTGERPYQCNVCNKRYNDNTTLRKHVRIHSGEKPYQCNVCKKCFNQKTYLTKHIRTHAREKQT